MKRIFTLLLFTSIIIFGYFNAKASHIAAGRISYECIAPNQYRVSMLVWRDCSGVSFNQTTIPICYRNNCGVEGTITAYLTPGSGAPMADPCTNLPLTTCNGGNRFGVEQYEFEAIFNVDRDVVDTCQDWFFGAQPQCCRNNSITSIGGGTMFVSAYLNNRIAVNPCNSSTLVDVISVPDFCTGDPVVLDLGFFDPNNDSLRFSFEQAQQPRIGQTCFGDGSTYTGIYTPTTPGSSSTPFIIDPLTGKISFTPNITQEIVFVVKCEEWRENTLVGWTWIDFQVTVEPDPIICTQSKVPTYTVDTVELSCGERFVDFQLSTNINCNSVSPNGSEFRLFKASTGQAIPIDSTYVLNCLSTTNLADEFRVLFFEQLVDNGIYYMYSKIGSDGNTLGNQCFRSMDEYDTLVLVVKDCYDYDTTMNLINVSVEPNTNEDFEVQWQKPAGFDFNYFDKYLLYRRFNPQGMAWELVQEITDSTQLTFTDLNPPRLPSENSMYYAIQLEYLPSLLHEVTKKNPLSNDLNSILLRNDPVEDDKENEHFDLAWNHYRGWMNPTYTIEYKSVDGTEWIEAGTTSNNFYQFTKPRGNGDYLIRVYTDGTVDGESLRSYSNWTPFCVPIRELEVPNVFTPNNDGINDFFELKNVDFYPNTSVLIYNRWGNLVFESGNYLNEPGEYWDGSDVKTGVYYYVIEVPGESEVRKGAIKVINN